MKSKLIKLFLGTATVAFTTVSLSSCASSQINTYGVYAPIVSNYGDPNSTTDSQKLQAYSFNNIAFNNFNYSTTSAIYTKGDDGSIASISNGYATNSWTGVLYNLVSFVSSLSDLYIMGFAKNNTNWQSSIITVDSSVSNQNDLLNQFIYSWSNSLKITNSSLIRFGITGVSLLFNDGSSTTTSNVTSGLYPTAAVGSTAASTLSYNKDNSIATFDSTTSFQIAFRLSYWNAFANNPGQQMLSTSDVQTAIDYSGTWGTVNNLVDSMYLVLNYSSIKTILSYAGSALTEANPDLTIDDNTTSITWDAKYDEGNGLIPTFNFQADSAAFSSTIGASTFDLNDTNILNAKTIISDLSKSANYNSQTVIDEKNKYSNSLILYSSLPVSFLPISNFSN